MSPAGGGDVEASDADSKAQLRGHQIRDTERNVERGLIGFAFIATLTTILLYSALKSQIVIWCLCVMVFCTVRVLVARRIVKAQMPALDATHTRNAALWSVVAASVMIGYPIWVTMHHDGFAFAYMLALTLGTFWCASFIHAPVLPSAVSFMVVQLVIGFVSAAHAGWNWERGVLLALFASGTGTALYVIRQQSSLFGQSVLQQIELRRKTEVIALLLREHEDETSDWLWRTDADLRITQPSPRFTEVWGADTSFVEGQTLQALLDQPQTPGNGDALARILAHVEARRSMRDLVIPYTLGSEQRWFCLSGRPVFARGGAFSGYRGVMADVTVAKIAEARVIHLAHHDALTDLPNRTQLWTSLNRSFGSGRVFALLAIDLDGFKPVNDKYGHPVGDALLVEVARRCQSIVSSSDLVARVGGDEFTIQTWQCEPNAVETLCRNLIAAIGEPLRVGDVEVVVGVSIGVAFAPADGHSKEEILKSADAALYRAKHSGRGTYRFFAPEMDQQLQIRQAMIQDLRLALARGELLLHYQPFIDVQTGGVTGCEALLRWAHPDHGLVPPQEFVPLAEESGLIVAIGAWVIEEACREAAGWPKEHRVSVNVSPIQFRDGQLPERILSALVKSGLAPKQLEIEVTETVLVDDADAALGILQRIRALGVRVALDDFGTGYSSLSYLRRFPFDKIKIDRSFVSDLDTREDSQVIVRAIRDIAIGLGMTITAEGVETAEQAAQLRITGCHEFQGYLFSRPRPSSGLLDAMALRYAA